MAALVFHNSDSGDGGRRSRLGKSVLVVWALLALAGAGIILSQLGLGQDLGGTRLVFWVVISGAVVVSPSIYLYTKHRFDPFHPLVFAAWSYILPAFVFGGLILYFGWSRPYFLSYIDAPEYNLPLSLAYVSIGFLAATVGYATPVGRILAEKVRKIEPRLAWDPSRGFSGGLGILAVGLLVTIFGLTQGLVGFQKLIGPGTFDAWLPYLMMLITEGSVALWIFIFSKSDRSGSFYLVLAILVALFPIRMILLGSRSSLLLGLFPIILAFNHSGRKLRGRSLLIFGSLAVLAVSVGMIYASTFRELRGGDSTSDPGEYISQAGQTVEFLVREDPAVVLEDAFDNLAARVENLSSLAVVVANYEKLAPYEEAYGLENNIWNDAVNSIVPRFLWPDKPETTNVRLYSELYFQYGENSFAISPFGDLLRNFGPVGIPVGMFFVGIYLRLIYVWLIEAPDFRPWRLVAYLPLLTVITYEGFYASYFPSLVRSAVVVFSSIFLVSWLSRNHRDSRSSGLARS